MTINAIAGLFFTIVGVVILTSTAVNFVYALLSRRWPHTPGTVLASRLESGKGVDGEVFRADVSYRYTVNGEEFVGSRTRFGDRIQLSWRGAAMRVVRRYRVGTAVDVRYDPDDPADAVLEAGVNWYILASWIFGGFFTLIGVFVLLE